ncbi:chitin disaccharide deacetylase [Neobacillus drentensis]|uniref:chitin disaccharide deacetylase n=1 Tax=Neobacillus drentensis TaxID=220684 RepID=UPI002FFF0057
MIKLIVNADDFGFSPGVNYGIIHAHLHGIVNSTTMMMNMAGTNHAIDLAKDHSNLRVGIHLVLTCGKPLLEDVPSLMDQNGQFRSLSHLNLDKISLDDVEREWTAQIERFISTGLKPDHLDSHHHVHTKKELQPVVKNLSQKYGLPVRKNGTVGIDGVKSFSDLALFDFYGDGVKEDYFLNLASRVEVGKTVEIMCHPAFIDEQLLMGSSYTFQRVLELDLLTSVQLDETIILL